MSRKTKTEREQVTGRVSVWAIPLSEWERDKPPNKGKMFKYQLLTSDPYTLGAVKVHTDTVTIVVPEGINLLEKALETLDQRARDAYEEYTQALAQIEKQKDALRLLAYMPEEEAPTDTDAASTIDGNAEEVVDVPIPQPERDEDGEIPF